MPDVPIAVSAQKSKPNASPVPPLAQPGTAELSLRWKHLSPLPQSASLSQSPWHAAHFCEAVQPLLPLLTKVLPTCPAATRLCACAAVAASTVHATCSETCAPAAVSARERLMAELTSA